MDKEFEALESLFDLVCFQGSFEKAQKCYDILDEALTELKQIKEAQPSEAMECVDDLIFNFTVDEYVDRYDKNLVTIKNYIFNTQEQEKENAEYKKVLEIIREHLTFEDSGIEVVKDFINDKEETKYIIKVISKDTGATIHIHLDTKEEIDLLKRYLNGK